MNNTNNLSARACYEHATRVFFKAMRDKFNSDAACWAWVNSLKFSQSEIRLEVELNAVNNSFTFGVTPNQANSTNVVFNTENRLNLQDSLVVNEYGIYMANPASRIDANYELKTYGNPIEFPTGNVAGAIDGTFYSNGNFQVRCNNDVIAPYRGLFNHWYKPQTQQTAALGAASPADQIRGCEDAMITMEPNMVLIGSKNYQPQIVLPIALAATETFQRAVLILRGILAQNSTVVN